MSNIDSFSTSVIRGLILDTTRKANSGHPGGAMSSTDFVYLLHKEFLNYNPHNPNWFNRDRFILSAGHESTLLYSMLVLQGFLPIDELKNFRQLHSKTPGHPEFGFTDGVEATTGPLGQGISMAVGIALAEEHLRAKFGSDVVNHFTYVVVGDGDLQEPIALGSASLAGHWALNKLIVFYDKNNIQISGSTSRSDSTNIKKVFEGLLWNVIEIDGHNHSEIRNAIKSAQLKSTKPTIIIGSTTMAKGLANREGDHETHGSPLPNEEIIATKIKLGLPDHKMFYLPKEVLDNFRTRWNELVAKVENWNVIINQKLVTDINFKTLWQEVNSDFIADNLEVPEFSSDKPLATRAAFGKTLVKFAEQLQTIVGGSADLEPSNNTKEFANLVGEFTIENRLGRNLSFGVREFPMAAIVNGLALHGGIKPFGATFLVFSDYARHAIRLSAMMHLHVMFVFTHDSFYVGEDGPTHQPIEHIASLRLIPNLLVFRPADATETSACMRVAADKFNCPSILALTRQNLPILNSNSDEVYQNVQKGGYIVYETENQKKIDMIFIATGSEVHLAISTAKAILDKNIRVISMPSVELFEKQSDEYKNQIFPKTVRFRVSVEAGVTKGWEKYVGLDGFTFGIDNFGASAPYEDLEKEFGFTTESLTEIIISKYQKFLAENV